MNSNSRQLVEQLPLGEHRLHNTELRSAYGLSRVTARARADIARELRKGLEILSDPANEPLVVRKTALGQARVSRIARPWWRRRWARAIAGSIALIMLIGALSDIGLVPATIAQADSLVTTGSPSSPFPRNGQWEPHVAIDPSASRRSGSRRNRRP